MTDEHQPEGLNTDPVFSSILAECPELWDIVEHFARALPDQIQELESALHNGALSQIEAVAHALVTAGKGHGYPDLAEQAAAVEASARDHLLCNLEMQLEELHDLARQIKAGIEMQDGPDNPS